MLDPYDRNQHYSVASWGVGGGTAASDASTSDETTVHSGGRGGSGAYTVGWHLISHGWVLRERVFMWWDVTFFCGSNEHSYHHRTPTQSWGCLPHTKRHCRRTTIGLKIVFGEVSKTGFFYLAKNFKNSVISH